MVRNSLILLCAALVAACAPSSEASESAQDASAGAPTTEQAKIQSAMSAAPPEIAAGATILDWPASEGGEMAQLRSGTNGWTCLPDVPDTADPDPMCLDEVFLAWAGAWQSKTQPNVTRVGLSYMLQGDSGASVTDPYATGPTADNQWVKTAAHVMMIVPNAADLEGLSTDPSTGGPYVMWKGTPYAHIMMPVPAPR